MLLRRLDRWQLRRLEAGGMEIVHRPDQMEIGQRPDQTTEVNFAGVTRGRAAGVVFKGLVHEGSPMSIAVGVVRGDGAIPERFSNDPVYFEAVDLDCAWRAARPQ